MARIKLSEFRAKKLIAGEGYKGISVGHSPARLPKKGKYVVKVDEGIKKRFLQGLVAVDVAPGAVPRLISRWKKKGFSRFLVEPFVTHKSEEEQYLSLERVRGGIRVLHAEEGGVEIEKHPEKVTELLLASSKDIDAYAETLKIPKDFFRHLIGTFESNLFAFLEINPYIIRGGDVVVLDAALIVDDTGKFFLQGAWSEADVVEGHAAHSSESAVAEIAKTTPASLKLTVLNKNAPVFLLLSGGGGSIVIADEAYAEKAGTLIGNYGEYSGGPTRAETHLYSREVIRLMLASRAKKKALVIAGGIANFTDIKSTFQGIIDTLAEAAPKLRQQKVKVFIRRGGPNERAGLSAMKSFLEKEKLLGSVHGSDALITLPMTEAIKYVRV